MLDLIVRGFAAVIEYLALYGFLWMFFEPDPRRKAWIGGCHIVMPVLFFLFALYVPNVYVRPMLFIVCSWLIAWGFQGNGWTRIFSVTVFQTILILSEILLFLFFQPLMDSSKDSFYIANNLLTRLQTLLILAALFLLSRRRKRLFMALQFRKVMLLLSFSAVSMLMMFFIDYLLVLLDRPALFALGCLLALLCVFINIGLYDLFVQLSNGEEAKARLQFLNFQFARQKEEQEYLHHTYQEVRKLSHDLNHYLSAIYDLLQQGHVDQAMTELQKRQLSIGQNPLFDTGYTMLNSILSYKFQIAQQKQIRTQLFWNIKDPIQINLTDLAVLLSNGLDNAIEAASQVEDQQPFLSVHAENDQSFLYLRICNNTAVEPVIVDDAIATSKQDKQLHGLGLESVRMLAQHYGGSMRLQCEDHVFTLTVLLQNRSVPEPM